MGICNQARVFAEDFASHEGTGITMKEFSAFLDMRRCKNCAPKICSWKYLSEDLFCQFCQSTSASFGSPLWIPIRWCWRPAATTAGMIYLILVDGKCQWKVPICRFSKHLWWQYFGKKTLYVFKQHSNVRIYPKTGSFVLRVCNTGEQGSIYSGTNDNCLSI